MAEQDLSAWKLHEPVHQVCKQNRTCAAKLQRFLSKQIWTQNDREEILTALTSLFMSGGDCVVDLCIWFGPLILEIVSRLTASILCDGHAGHKVHRKLAVVLSTGFIVSTELQSYAVDMMELYKPFSGSSPSHDGQPHKKKAKLNKISDLDWCRSMWTYLTYLPQVADRLDLASLPDFLSHADGLVRWYAASALSVYLGMSERETAVFFKKYFTAEEQRMMTLRVETEALAIKEKLRNAKSKVSVDHVESNQSHTLQALMSGDLCPQVVSVMGILLRKVEEQADDSDVSCSPLVMVESTQHHLRSLALAVACGQPVMLQGPVGCGKTSLVEHLATLTGRCGFPHLLKIQLGDQTDSKALLGTYCSTEVPGEFVWRAGVLTRAVTEGRWVLLEDVDTAPMDVLSLLVALAETRTLTVPGHGQTLRAAPGFQLFTTLRLMSSSEGMYGQGGNSALLEKLCTVISVCPLSREELKQVLTVRFPALVPVSEKLLDVYFQLSSGRHDHSDLEQQGRSSTDGKFLSLGGRLISTRDLMRWCGRSSVDFDHKESSQGLKVFLEALDCFVACLAKPVPKLSLATMIAGYVNISEERARYFCKEHKPTLRESPTCLEIGRAKLTRRKQALNSVSSKAAPTFSYTRSSVALLEKVAVCVQCAEPVLLVGETGTGKTSTVQFLAHHLGHKLHVINLNQQSDSTDLLGGFKPVDLKFVIMPLREEFESLFCQSFSRSQNEKFLSHIQTLFTKKRWKDLLTLMDTPVQKALNKFTTGTEEWEQWTKVAKRIQELRMQIREVENVLAFTFIEGTLVRALKNGDWVLLDEINLAAAETLECLSGLLESVTGSVVLTERGDAEPVQRHSEFRLFACMNPATDVGKKDLPVGIRNRFAEFYVEELECPKDLSTLVRDYLPGLSLTSKQVTGMVNFYLAIKSDPLDKLTDGTGHRPHFSLRTLCRALRYCARNPCRSVPRSLFEGFCLSFLTQLDRSSHPVVEAMVCKHILSSSSSKAILSQKLPRPDDEEGDYVKVTDYWISQGKLKPEVPPDYIITPSVKLNLKDLSRVVSAGRHPILLQGETSVGKTSLITYLACLTGNVCVRVNNHEHTDLQEYVGCYAADQQGKLVFVEGVLVQAMRKGHWIILDELNLAPTDVLEALNRLLDDNQELYIPETQEMVQAHPKFRLFATQNPPGQYGGRKILSRAFRNRFIELHFDEIPPGELETILHERCGIPLSYARKLVAVMLELQTRRRGSGIFSGKHGFMTLRDLFRWAQRYNCPLAGKGEKFYDWDQHLAEHGFLLLAGRVRKEEEETIIQEVLEKHLKRKVEPAALFSITPQTSAPVAAMLNSVLNQSLPGFQHIMWTYSMRRLAVLIGQAIRFKEPILLVGDTGVGKTTICQLYAALQERALYSVNCHMHTESADFLGGLRPVRSHEATEDDHRLFEWKDGPLVLAMKEGAMFLIDEISLADDSVLERLNSVLEPERTLLLAERGGGAGSSIGGPADVEKLQAEENFQLFATMNPGGDFGKKELSPALRNRFTEIWCPQSYLRQDLVDIIEKNIQHGLHLYNTQDGTSGFGHAIMDFVEWFLNTEMGKRATVSVRDILSWVHFINTCSSNWTAAQDSEVAMETEETWNAALEPAVSFVHGACLVFIDGLGAGSTGFSSESSTQACRLACLSFLNKQLMGLTGRGLDFRQCGLYIDAASPVTHSKSLVVITDQVFSIPPFSIQREPAVHNCQDKFAFQAPTTCLNGQRLLRGLQLSRPILLEGSPGVGKTSLVAAVARVAGKKLVRINLSEQTDVTDLFGADLPVEGQEGGRFAWRDGPFLQALKAGHWVVFDELNLASQSVLEGLNACFDHRAQVYIPELGRSFHIQHQKTRIFACQNPLSQGGGRKGLPRSFLNRFTQVYVDPLTRADLVFICTAMYPEFSRDMLESMVDFNSKLCEETMVKKLWGGRGAPWEFNLRDLFRWCDLLKANQDKENVNPGEYVGLVYRDRMRTAEDKQKVEELYRMTLGPKYPLYQPSRKVALGHSLIQAGHSFLLRDGHPDPGHLGSASGQCLVLHHCLEPLESLMKCVEMGWLAILLGPQSSGKTSLVRLLAQLSGRHLCVLPMNSSMDTTELLGGFEQADIWRHVGELATKLQQEVKRVQRACLVEGEPRERVTVQSLETDMAEYRQLHISTEGLSSQEMIELLSQHVKQLHTVLLHLNKVAHHKHITDRLGDMEQELSRLSTAVGKMTPGVGGGAFEWVDSVLVQALKDGHWLLIDNVNFCSASVLDRLNALLEPGGVLSVDERGTVGGELVTVVPHPNFRLFFAMDPRLGEISRAMRNRGIEIYIPGEDDGCPYSDEDITAMLKEVGLSSHKLRDWLTSLHATLKSEMSFGERPVLADLLQAASTCASLIDRGFDMKEAAGHAVHDVYVSSKRNSAVKQQAADMVNQHTEKLSLELSDLELDLLALTRPLAGERSNMTHVKQCAKLMLHLVQSSAQDHSLSSRLCKIKLEAAAVIFASHQSEHGWCLAHQWLETVRPVVMAALSSLCSGEQETQEGNTMLSWITALTASCMRQVFESSTWRQHKKVLDSVYAMCPTAVAVLNEQPWDLTLNPEAGHRLTLELVKEQGRALGQEERQALHQAQQLLCRLQLMQVCVLVAARLKDKMSALESRVAVGKKKAPVHPALGMVSLLVSELSDRLPHLVEILATDDFTHLSQNPHHLLWLERLAELAMQPPASHGDVFSAHLSLHWHWVQAKLAPLLTDTQNECPKLVMAVEELRRHLGGADNSVKLYVKFWTSYGYPRPFTCQKEAELALTLLKVISAIHVKVTDSLSVLQKKAEFLTRSGTSVQGQLAEVTSLLARGEREEARGVLQIVTAQVVKSGLLSANTAIQCLEGEDKPGPMDVVDKPASTAASQFVNLWPLFEHISLLAQLAVVVEGLDRHKRSRSDGQEQEVMATDDDDDQTDDLNYLDHYLLSHTPHISVFRRCNSADWQTDLHQLLTKLWTSAACRRPLCWLDWSHDQGELTNQETDQGPAALHQATLARFVTHGLSSRSEVSQAELLPLQVSLGGVEDQMKQVALVARHVWCHSSVVTSPTYDTRLLERKLLFKSFLKLLQALQCLLTPAEQTSWVSILESLVQSELVTQSVVGDLGKIIGGSTINLPSQMLAIISRCFHVVLDVWSGGLSSPEQTSCQLGRGFVYVGLLLTQLLSPRGPVDPVEKAGIKLKHVNQEIEDVEAELSVWNLHLELNTARDITSTHSDHLHPRVTALLRRRDKLKGTKTKLEQRWAYRPDQLQYTQLCQAIASFMENSGSLSRVSDLVSKLGMTTHPSPLHHGVIPIVTAIQEERVWQSTTERFVSGLESNFPCFRDVVVPFVVAVQQMKLGLRLLAQETERSLTVEKVGRADSIQSVVHHLCSFPTISQSAPDLLTLASHMTASVTHDLVSAVAHTRPANEEVKGQVQRTKSRLLLCALMLMKAHSFTTGQLTKDLVSALTRVLDLFTSAWWEQEERRRQREAEMSALYRYKEQTHGDERSENEREEAEFKAAYPTYEKEFMDVTGADRLEDVGQETSAATDMSMDKTGVISLEGISPKDMEQVCSVHRDLLITLSHADWLEVNSGDLSTQADLLNPCVLAYKISADVIRDVWQVLGPETDGHVIGSHLVVAGSIHQSLTLQDVNGSTLQSESRKDVRKTYNIYYDSNIPEVIKCRPVIDSLRGRVSELQREWPDHPTLVLLNQIMDRILSFSVSSPVLKFLTGLELLLQKAQDWESNAASFVSMATQLREITAVIVDWRKLELSCWSSALDRLEERCGEKASHWWFHLYQLTSQFLASAQSASHQDIDQSSKQEILTSLKKFVESSSMGEYCTRLQMLYAFHCHLVYMEESPAQKWLLHVLWNLRMFYQQYQPAVVEEMKRLRAPIDKQLKGFVKIARWSDMNYWALKTSTEKSHRTVHKYIKEYQAVLEQPCKSMLGDKGDDLVSQAVKQTSESMLEQQMAAFTQTLLQRLRKQQTQGPASSDMSSGVTSDLTLMSRLPSLLKKMKSHLRKHVAGSQYARMVLSFDGFTGELIQEIHELQALQVDMSADKEKQKSEARSINLRKRKGLAELFKYLAQIGLSYRKGVTRKSETGLADALDLPPLNLGVQPQLGVSSLWSGSQMYLYRCMSRHAQFSVSIVSPSKELGMAEIERCRGFVEHFSQLYVEQRSRLTCLTSDYLALRKLLSSVESLHQMSSHVLPPQSQAHSWLKCTKQLTTQLGQGLCQFSLLLEACPTHQDGYPLARVHPSPIPPHKLAPAALWCRGDPAWTECYDLVQSMVKQIKVQQQKVDTLIDRTLLGRSDMETVSAVLDTYSSLTPHLLHICSQFANNNDNNSTTASHNQLVTSLSYLCGQVSSTCDQFSHWWTGQEARISDSASSGSVCKEEDVETMKGENRQHKTSAADFVNGVEKLVETLLLCVQRVVKTGEAETATSDGGNDDDDEKDEEEEEELLDNHLTTHLLEREKTLLAGLCCSQVNSQLKTLLSTLCSLSEKASTTSTHMSQASAVSTRACIQHLCQAQHLLSTFGSLVEHQLAQGVALHRSMGKLLSVLLAVFTELSQKGFCLPAELSEELEGEGATEFKDIEGGGLGEGEGAKDVSDQIETEDQLEEAKQAGQEEKAEDNKDESDIPAEDNAIEMSHDIDGKLHDMEGKDDNDEDDEKDEKEEEEDMEKQMGEAEGEQSDRLDERMWGSDEEEEDGEDEQESKEDQGGGGMDRQKEEMVAKDDNRDAAEAGEEEEDRQKEKDKQQPQDQINDDEDYDDNQVNPHELEEEEDEPRDMDLADDLHLDDGDRKEEDMEEDQDTEDQENKQEEEGKDDQDGQTQEAEDDSKQEGAEEDVPTQIPDIQEPGADDEGEDDDKDKAEEQGRAEKDDEDDEEGKGEDGTSGQEEEKPCAELSRDRDEEKEAQEKVDTVDEAGDTDQQAQMAERKGGGAEQEEEARRERQEEEEEEREGVGAASSEDHQGHVGQKSRQTTEGPSQQKQVERTPGQSDKDRSLGSHDRKHKRLKTRETTAKTTDITEEEEDSENERNTNGEYEHIKDSKSQSDAQTVDVATADQMLDKQAVPTQADEEEGDEVDEDDDVKMDEDETEEMDDSRSKEKRPAKSKNQEKDRKADEEEGEEGGFEEREKVEVEGEHVLTMMVERPPESTMHTLLENLHLDSLGQELDVDALRAELEHKVKVWSHPEVSSPEMERAAVEAWQKYQAITGPLSQDLCEQLRLILEPSQATKLRGDYRTGKRLNMRKVIPYIASQFRKDKIWLRRSKPSKRQYQILIAVDDSASMADNHSKQLAFESLALVSNALTLLESGELAVCSFGEEMRLLHPFSEPFTSQSGARILQQLTCDQKQTKYGMLLDKTLTLMLEARSRQPSTSSNADTAQLVLILSDGHGVFREGMETVRRAVRRARSARIFLVFVIMDNPDKKGSILDDRVPIMEASGKIKEIKSYMEMFPFPFYIILRDINSMPQILSDSLRQWFELVTASDR